MVVLSLSVFCDSSAASARGDVCWRRLVQSPAQTAGGSQAFGTHDHLTTLSFLPKLLCTMRTQKQKESSCVSSHNHYHRCVSLLSCLPLYIVLTVHRNIVKERQKKRDRAQVNRDTAKQYVAGLLQDVCQFLRIRIGKRPPKPFCHLSAALLLLKDLPAKKGRDFARQNALRLPGSVTGSKLSSLARTQRHLTFS